MRLKALLVDDESHARENLKFLLENNCPEIEVVALADSVDSALMAITRYNPQVLFLDICMPSGTEGFDLLEQLPEKKFQVVFVTAFSAFAIRALNANAIHYLMKPVDLDELKLAVGKLLRNNRIFNENETQRSNYIRSLENLSDAAKLHGGPTRITIDHEGGFAIVDPAEIMYLESINTQTQIRFTNGSSYTDARSINVYEDLLDTRRFFRIHKTHIVNVQYVNKVVHENGQLVVMSDQSRFPISRLRAPRFATFFEQFKKN